MDSEASSECPTASSGQTPPTSKTTQIGRDSFREQETTLTQDHRPPRAASVETSATQAGVGQASSIKVTTAREEVAPGDRIGPYRIDRQLGKGGMGVVYLATRTDDFEQQVALKLVASGHQTVEILDRFYKERQILASLQHPHIARLLDGGSTGDAWPYLVMEYVDGEPIDRYCNGRGLSLSARLALFIKVCGAVQVAHQSLVVHRDLKPGNILVTPDGEPKLLDFGIAKILGPRIEDARDFLVTAPACHPMTPAFASPEQVAGKPLTTGSDVYALGVLLYWLVSGQPPYRLANLSPQELVHTICEEEPLPPSVAVSSSGQAGDKGDRRARALVGDIDAIIQKAMRKEPAQRYGSAAQMADDLQCHLDGLPVSARAGTWRYHAGKLARRHKAALAFLVALVAFSITSTVLWRQAVAARGTAEAAVEHAEAEAAQRQSVVTFLEDLFTAADPNLSRGAEVPVREVLDRGRERIATSLDGSPELRAELLGTLGTVYNNLGDLASARALKQEALALRRASDIGDRPELAIDLNNLARLHADLGDPGAAVPLLREAIAITARLGDAQRNELARLNLAGILAQLGKGEEAVEQHRRVFDQRRARLGSDSVDIAPSLFGLGFAEFSIGRFDAAETHLREALALYRAAHGDEHTWVASVNGTLGLVLHARGQLDDARDSFEASLGVRQRLLGDEHVSVATVQKNLAAVLLDQGEVDAAGRLLGPAMEVLRARRKPDDWALAQAEAVWGSYLSARGQHEEADAVLQASLDTLMRVKGEQDVFARDVRDRLARARRQGEASHPSIERRMATASHAGAAPP